MSRLVDIDLRGLKLGMSLDEVKRVMAVYDGVSANQDFDAHHIGVLAYRKWDQYPHLNGVFDLNVYLLSNRVYQIWISYIDTLEQWIYGLDSFVSQFSNNFHLNGEWEKYNSNSWYYHQGDLEICAHFNYGVRHSSRWELTLTDQKLYEQYLELFQKAEKKKQDEKENEKRKYKF